MGYQNKVNEKGEQLIWLDLLLARQLTRSTVLSAQISTLDTSADLPSAYFHLPIDVTILALRYLRPSPFGRLSARLALSSS